MKTPGTERTERVCTSLASAPADILDQLHTISALLDATLSIADAGNKVERCLSVAAVKLQRVIKTMSSMA